MRKAFKKGKSPAGRFDRKVSLSISDPTHGGHGPRVSVLGPGVNISLGHCTEELTLLKQGSIADLCNTQKN